MFYSHSPILPFPHTQHPYFTEQDIASMESYSEADGFRGVDLLLTSEWPKGVENYTSPPVRLSHMLFHYEACTV